VLVVVFADAVGFGAGDEHALASTKRPASGARESRESLLRTAADYTRLRHILCRLVKPAPPDSGFGAPSGLTLSPGAELVEPPVRRVAAPLGDVGVARVWGRGYPKVNSVCHQVLCVDACWAP
jgi:hypothetical protein